jgi:hypothetical protein
MGVNRASTVLWKAADTAGAAGASAVASVGTKSNVVIFIQTISVGGALTFKIQAAPTLARSAGMNEDLSGAVWHDIVKPDGTALVLTAPDNSKLAFDASPYAAENFRLVSVEGFAAGKVVASLTATGDD